MLTIVLSLGTTVIVAALKIECILSVETSYCKLPVYAADYRLKCRIKTRWVKYFLPGRTLLAAHRGYAATTAMKAFSLPVFVNSWGMPAGSQIASHVFTVFSSSPTFMRPSPASMK